MGLIESELNKIADDEATRLVYMAVFTADPGATGANEATGGTPAYARQAVTWNPAAAGTAAANQVTFDLPAGTYTHGGYFDAATAGNFLGGAAFAAAQTLADQGQLKVTGKIPVTSA